MEARCSSTEDPSKSSCSLMQKEVIFLKFDETCRNYTIYLLVKSYEATKFV